MVAAQVKFDNLPTICTTSPLLSRIVSRALARGDISGAMLSAEAAAAGDGMSVARWVTSV